MKNNSITGRVFGFIVSVIFMVVIEVNMVFGYENEWVDITTEDGAAMMIRGASTIYTAVPIRFTLKSLESERCYYSLSVDDGKTFGGFVLMEKDNIILYPDFDNVPNGVFILKFKKEVNITNDDFVSEEENRGEPVEIISEEYRICFDFETPQIEVNNSEVLEGWIANPKKLSLTVSDRVGYISRVVASCEGEVIYENHYNERDSVKKCNLMLELNKEAETDEGSNIIVKVQDCAGNMMTATYNYFLDSGIPDIEMSGVEDGAVFDDNAMIKIKIVGRNGIFSNLMYFITKNIDGVTTQEDVCINAKDIPEGKSIYFEDEGDYSIKAYAVSPTGNKSKIYEKKFRIDRNPPQITMIGVEEGMDYSKPIDMRLCVNENFETGCDVNVRIIRKRQDMAVELPLIVYKTEALQDERTLNLINDGDYIVYAEAVDSSGKKNQVTKHFRIDATPPLIVIDGLNNGEITNEKPRLKVGINDVFFDATLLSVVLNKKDKKGNYQTISEEKFIPQKNGDNKEVVVDGEGDYIVRCIACDRTGNATTEEVRFSVDYTPPVIQSLDSYNQKYFSNFQIPQNIKNLITDNSDYEYEAYLNDNIVSGGENVIKEGKYTLWVSAQDAAGNTAYDTAEFIVDHTAPQIVVSGVRSDGSISKGENVIISVNDDMDKLQTVLLNDKEMQIDEEGRVSQFVIGEYGEYDIKIKACDEAGNVADVDINVTCSRRGLSDMTYINNQKPIINDNVENEDNNGINDDLKGIIIGVFTMLSGTYGLVFRGIVS